MMHNIKIFFADFWSDFDYNSNFIVDTLRLKYNVTVGKNGYDYLFYSSFGYDNQKKENEKVIKIYFTGENTCPDFNLTDYAIAFDHISFGDRYLRLPLYCTYPSFAQLSSPKQIVPEQVLNRKFCSFVYSNSNAAHPARQHGFEALSKYKQVDAGGKMFNNVGGMVADKLTFMKDYKFSIAFENSMVNGYTTEKIADPMAVNSLPIYWGNRLISMDFNPKSFVYAPDFASWEELTKYITHLDQNDNEYLDILSQPWITDSKYLKWEELLLDFLSHIIDRPYTEAKILQPYGYSQYYLSRLTSPTQKTPSLTTRIIRKVRKLIK